MLVAPRHLFRALGSGDLPPRVVPPFKLELESFEVQPIPATS